MYSFGSSDVLKCSKPEKNFRVRTVGSSITRVDRITSLDVSVLDFAID